jgi:hypothetical protein
MDEESHNKTFSAVDEQFHESLLAEDALKSRDRIQLFKFEPDDLGGGLEVGLEPRPGCWRWL